MIGILVLGVLGIVLAILLAWASKRFETEENSLIPKVLSVLPGVNCGGCGYAGCKSYAKAIVEKDEDIGKCIVGKEKVTDAISKIVGRSGNSDKLKAVVHCLGGRNAKNQGAYAGVRTCKAAAVIGYKKCSFGCLGFGDCVSACTFDAISIGKEDYPIINKNCVGCGACAKACPKNLISVQKETNKVHVRCMSKNKGPIVMKACNVGCIGCGACERKCPHQAIKVEKNVAVIDYSKCVSCGVCVQVCPRKIITKN